MIVHVYGGKNLSTRVSSPSQSSTDMLLTQAGCAVVHLHLPDLMQGNSQHNMDLRLHDTIHQGINHFYELLSSSPEQIDPRLKELKLDEADKYLFGASFGGRTAVRHGQLYPGTFDGYISHDGALAPPGGSDLPIISTARKMLNEEELLPIYHNEKTQEPVLILQNRDDNNVSVKVALQYYANLKELGKEDLARLVVFEKGSKLSRSASNKGHHTPDDEVRYIDTISQFITEGTRAIPELNEMTYLMQQHVSSQNLSKDSPQDRFLTVASQRLRGNLDDKIALHHRDRDKSWQKKSDPGTEFDSWDVRWQKDYEPLVIGLMDIDYLVNNDDAFEERITQLADRSILTDDRLKNAMKSHGPSFLEFMRESNELRKGPELDVSIEELLEHEETIELLRTTILSMKSSDTIESKRFLLEAIYLNNPDILPRPTKEECPWLEQDFKELSDTFKQSFEQEQEKLIASAREVWKSVAKVNIEQTTQSPSREVLASGSTERVKVEPGIHEPKQEKTTALSAREKLEVDSNKASSKPNKPR